MLKVIVYIENTKINGEFEFLNFLDAAIKVNNSINYKSASKNKAKVIEIMDKIKNHTIAERAIFYCCENEKSSVTVEYI